MDFTPRSDTPHQSGSPAPARPAAASNGSKQKSNRKWTKILTISSIILLFLIGILIVLVVAKIMVTDNKSQSKYVNENEMQAVFLNGGQVYFGNITRLNSQYIALSNIYYLRVNQQVQPGQESNAQNDVSLVKLGCELHGPQDEMVINADQVVFWENLKGNGQVAQAVQEYVKQNPNGQNCDVQQGQNTN